MTKRVVEAQLVYIINDRRRWLLKLGCGHSRYMRVNNPQRRPAKACCHICTIERMKGTG